MIRIPVCFSCEHYDFGTKTCPAHPEGFDGINLLEKEDTETDCGNGVGFRERENYESLP